jgi:hypothetical protein
MSKLDDIKTKIADAKEKIKEAGDIAKDAGDKRGQQDCEKVAEKVADLYNGFAKRR